MCEENPYTVCGESLTFIVIHFFPFNYIWFMIGGLYFWQPCSSFSHSTSTGKDFKMPLGKTALFLMMCLFAMLLFSACSKEPAPLTPEAAAYISRSFGEEDILGLSIDMSSASSDDESRELLRQFISNISKRFDDAGYDFDKTLQLAYSNTGNMYKVQSGGYANLFMIPVAMIRDDDPKSTEFLIKEGFLSEETVLVVKQMITKTNAAAESNLSAED